MIGKIENGRIKLPPMNDGNRFNVHLDPEWLEANEYHELTQEEIDAANTATKVALQETKTLALKQAENDYFNLIDSINADKGMNIDYKDNSTVIMDKAEAAELSMTEKSYYGMRLQNAIREVELKGGSWYDLPSQPHNI